MKKHLLLLVFLLMFAFATKEQEIPEKEIYVVGRFIITKDSNGYQAQTGGEISPYQDTMYNAIKTIQK